MSRAAFVIGVVVVLVLGLVTATVPAFAQTGQPPASPPGPGTGSGPSEVREFKRGVDAQKQQGEVNISGFTDVSLDSTVSKFYCMLGGDGDTSLCPAGPNGARTSAIQATGQSIGWIYAAKPASTEEYVASVFSGMKLGIAQPAYAQGLGFSSLSPILSVWSVMRNLAYFIFVVLFVVIGFMIMFKQKIGSQTVVTAQQAIPSIVIALILVTFSYAIAGLLIDAMYLIMYLIVALFPRAGSIPTGEWLNANIFGLTFNILSTNVVGSASEEIAKFITEALGGSYSDWLRAPLANLGGLFASATTGIIVFLVILFNTFKLFIALLRVYIELILSIAFAPIILMMGAIPGNNPFGGWVKNIVGNLMVFPAILLLVVIFETLRSASVGSSGGFLPPFLAGNATAGSIPFLAGLGLILALPEAVEQVKKAFGAGGGGIFGTLIEAGFKNAWNRRTAGIAGASAVIGGASTGLFMGGRELLFGGGSMKERVRRGFEGAGKGALYGGVGLPVLTTMGAPLIRGVGQNVMQQAQDVFSQDVVNAGIRKATEGERLVPERARRVLQNMLSTKIKGSTPPTNTQNPSEASQNSSYAQGRAKGKGL